MMYDWLWIRYIKGYVKGYDEARECYTSFYETLIKKFYDYEEERTTNVKRI